MKRKCKNIDITDIEFIKSCIQKCMSNKRKSRWDITRLKRKYGNFDNLAAAMQREIINKKLDVKEIWYSEKVDPSNHKVRRIGIQDIKQQIYDYIAVEGLGEILRRIGTYQCASIKGKGQLYGIRAVSRWVKDGSIRQTFMRARRQMTAKLAPKCCSYWGLLKHTDSFKFRKKYKVRQILNKARRVISHESKIRCAAA